MRDAGITVDEAERVLEEGMQGLNSTTNRTPTPAPTNGHSAATHSSKPSSGGGGSSKASDHAQAPLPGATKQLLRDAFLTAATAGT
jgi:hypothetical protein